MAWLDQAKSGNWCWVYHAFEAGSVAVTQLKKGTSFHTASVKFGLLALNPAKPLRAA